MPRVHRGAAAIALAVASVAATSATPTQTLPADSVCKPILQRTGDVGCWVITDAPVGVSAQASTYWHLDRYPTRAAASADKGPAGTVFESLGRVWLSTIATQDWRARHGEHVADIGPLPVNAGASVLGDVHGSDLDAGLDVGHPHACRPRGLVHGGGGDVSRDA